MSTPLDSPQRYWTTMNAAIPDVLQEDDEISLDHVMKLHNLEVSQGIEYRLRTSDKNFCKCYSKYLSLNKRIIFKCSGYNQVVIVLHLQMAKEKQVWKLEKLSTSREEIQTFPKILDKTCQMLVLQDKDTFGNTTLQLLQQ